MLMWKRRMQKMIAMQVEANVQLEVACVEAGSRSGSDFTRIMDVRIEAEAKEQLKRGNVSR